VAGKKMWCVPELDEDYIGNMEDVLNQSTGKSDTVAMD
jgi:hypothetical protein